MFPNHNFSQAVIECIQSFVIGDLPMGDFMTRYEDNREIGEFLEWVIDTMEREHIPVKRRTIVMKNVAQNKPFQASSHAERFIKAYAQPLPDISDQWKQNLPKVTDYLSRQSWRTAHGAVTIHGIVADIYYQLDPAWPRTERYFDEYSFSLDVLPGYLAGGISAESYVSEFILSKYPATLKKGERKRLIKEEIKQAFRRDCKGFPRWIQMPQWPMGQDGKPMVYTGQKSFEHHSEYYFRDESSGEAHTVTQYW